MRLFGPILLSTLLVPSSSSADKLQQAEQQLAALDYDKAVQTTRSVVGRGGLPLGTLQKAYALLGHALAGLGKQKEAKETFTRLLALNPGFTLKGSVSPKIRKPLAAAQADWAGRPGITFAHHPPAVAAVDQQLVLKFKVIEDPLEMVKAASVSYQLPGRTTSSTIRVNGERELVLAIPLPALGAKPGRLSYWLKLIDADGNAVAEKGPIDVLLGAATATPAEPVAPPEAAAGTPWYKRWWVWTIAGVVVAGAATTAVVLTTRPDESDIAVGWEVQK